MTTSKNLMELREQDIRAHYKTAFQLLEGFDHAPRIAKPAAETVSAGRSDIPGRRAFRSTTPGLAARNRLRPAVVSIVERIEDADDDDPLISARQATVLQALRRSLAVCNAVVNQYEEQTRLGELIRLNREGRMDPGQSQEFSEYLTAAALIAMHVFANMTTFLLSNHAGEAGDREVKLDEVKEVLTENPALGLKGALWELEHVLADHARDDEDLVPAIMAYCELLMEEISARVRNAARLEPFTAVSYRVESDDFTIDGFSPARRARSSTLVMTFKKPHEVVGNHIAKYQSLKLAKMLMAYDFQRQLNPFAELGGFIFTFMGDGKPGTGKTTLIQMMAGLLNEYCQNAGYPFRYANLSTESIDSYQGKSAQNAKAFIRSVLDPHVIGFGTVDDIDQIAGKRGDRQSSAGQQEITAVLMESFAGANTVVRGNCTFGMFSNYPENVDDALRQRAGARFLVDGPQTRDDYIDILHLLLGRNHDIPVGEHELYAAQEIRKAVAASYEAHSQPKEPGLVKVWEQVEGRIGELDTIAKMGTYLKAIQEADERFTGRAIKNITDAVKVRAMDFELPDEWMEDPALFLAKDYETKKNMIAELAKPITPEMVIQEINRYADSEFRYAGSSDEAAISQMVRDLGRQAEAKRRYLEENG